MSDDFEDYSVYKDNYHLRKVVETLQAEVKRLTFYGNEKVELTKRVQDAETKYRVAENDRATREHQVFCLAESITNAAYKAGIIADQNADLSGPQLMLLADDLAECILALQKDNDIKTDWIEETINDAAEAEYQKSLEIESINIGLDHGNIPLGLYRVHWKSGGSSIAAIGMNANGDRWFAPTNWISPSARMNDHITDIERLELIVHHKDR